MPSPRYTDAAEVFKPDFVPVMIPKAHEKVYNSVIQSCEGLWKPDECYQTARSLLELLTLPDTRNFMSVLPTLPDTTLPNTKDTDFDKLGYNSATLALWTGLSQEQRETFAQTVAGKLQWTKGLQLASKDVRSDLAKSFLSSLAALARGEPFTTPEEIRNWPGPSSGNPVEIEESIYTPRNVMLAVTDTSQAIRGIATSIQLWSEWLDEKPAGVHNWEYLMSKCLLQTKRSVSKLREACFRGWDGGLDYPELVAEPKNRSHDGDQGAGPVESCITNFTNSSHLATFWPRLKDIGNAWQTFMARSHGNRNDPTSGNVHESLEDLQFKTDELAHEWLKHCKSLPVRPDETEEEFLKRLEDFVKAKEDNLTFHRRFSVEQYIPRKTLYYGTDEECRECRPPQP